MCMLHASAVAGARYARRRCSLHTCGSESPRPPNSVGTAARRYPAARSSSKSSVKKRFSRSYVAARLPQRSSSSSDSTERSGETVAIVRPPSGPELVEVVERVLERHPAHGAEAGTGRQLAEPGFGQADGSQPGPVSGERRGHAVEHAESVEQCSEGPGV